MKKKKKSNKLKKTKSNKKIVNSVLNLIFDNNFETIRRHYTLEDSEYR